MPSCKKGKQTEAASTMTTSGAATFPLFPKLPLELRNNVWAQACLVTRNVDIKPRDLRETTYDLDNSPFYWYTSLSIPVVFHVSQES